jgi:hypothetical protein
MTDRRIPADKPTDKYANLVSKLKHEAIDKIATQALADIAQASESPNADGASKLPPAAQKLATILSLASDALHAINKLTIDIPDGPIQREYEGSALPRGRGPSSKGLPEVRVEEAKIRERMAESVRKLRDCSTQFPLILTDEQVKEMAASQRDIREQWGTTDKLNCIVETDPYQQHT